MPIDLMSGVTSLTNHAANKTVLGSIFTNPFWMSIIVVFAIFAILYGIGFTTDDNPTFKLLFYVFMVCFVTQIVHDGLIEQQIRESVETLEGQHLVETVNAPQITGQGYDIAPRSADGARQSFMTTVGAGVIDADTLLETI
jgi:hypothetical protein